MEMHQIRYFLALCQERNFTRAARHCDVAQPSLTNAIKRLERDLGGALFERGPNSTQLTGLGQLVRPHLELLDKCARDARSDATLFTKRARAKKNGLCARHAAPPRIANRACQQVPSAGERLDRCCDFPLPAPRNQAKHAKTAGEKRQRRR
jgi:DNA-binding transcriptional LysR family regulator